MKKNLLFAAAAFIMLTTTSYRNSTEPEMVFVKGGTFIMGCSTYEQGNDCGGYESPNHQVRVSDFYIGKYEITQKQWKEIMGTDVHQQRDKANTSWPLRGEGDNYPMYYVSWYEVQEFISRLNARTGQNYRLPTEAEWEYAARGGNKSQGYTYSGSNIITDVAWCNENSGEKAHPVGRKQANELGIHDMNGNVSEWCYDWRDYYSSYPQTDPMGPWSGTFRVTRGGGWNCYSVHFRPFFRGAYWPVDRDSNLGFRLVRSK